MTSTSNVALSGSRPSKPDKSPPTSARQRFDLSKVKVLIVDDHPGALEILAQILLGFCVTGAAQCRTVSAAAVALADKPYDLIIADGEMPEADGFDLTRMVRANPDGPNFTTPIIIASGEPSVAKIFRARDCGANFVVTKPIVPGVLLNRIEILATRPRPFISSAGYRGPDRRNRSGAPPEGVAERRAEEMKLRAEPDRALSQDDIDAIFD